MFLAVIELTPVLGPVAFKSVSCTERQTEYQAYKTVARKIVFLITVRVFDPFKPLAVIKNFF